MATKETHIYLGPSLPLAEARTRLDATYHPPIRRGDLGLLEAPADTIVGIVDGVFHQSPAVTVLEIRQLIEGGGTVYGASSMGALRAVELAPLGMIGVGQIYRDFLSGVLAADDEVALTFDPMSGRAVTIPLVHVRHVVARCVEAGDLDAVDAATAITAARHCLYDQRTRAELTSRWSTAFATPVVALLMAMLADPLLDPKRRDAIELLETIRARIDDGEP